jgi:hypothetical protein
MYPNECKRCFRPKHSRASRRRLSDNDIRCSASDRRWFPARPAQHVHRRRNNGKGRIQSALASAHGRNGKRRVETSSAGRAGAHRPSEALHPTRSSDVLSRITRERVPCLLETCYKEVPDSRESAPLPRFSRPGKRGAGETVASHGAF